MPYDFSNIKITNDPSFQDEMFAVTPQLKLQFVDLHAKAIDKNNDTVIEELIQMVIKHPYTPQLKNFLCVAYQIRGKMDKAKEVNQWMLSEHPTYLYAILNRANEHIHNKEYDKVEPIIGSDLRLEAFYPDRRIFHTSEMTAYMVTAIQYLCAVDRVSDAIIRFNIINDLNPTSSDVIRAGMFINDAIKAEEEAEAGLKPISWIQKNYDKQRRPIVSKVLDHNKYKIPKFIHPEILMLYRYDMDIPKNILQRILDLPRAGLIQDLEAVLADAEYNYQYYNAEDYDYEKTFFLIHATLLLGEIKATESLPKLLEIFKNNDEFLEFYYDDFIMENIWQGLFLNAENQRNLLSDFLMLDNTSTNGKIVVLSALKQFGYDDPSFSQQLNLYFEAIIDKSLDPKNHEEYLDTEFLGFIVADCLDFSFRNLMPKIKQLFKDKIVDVFMCGKWKAVKEQFDNPDKDGNFKEVMSIVDIYNNASKFDVNYKNDNQKNAEELLRIENSKPKNTYPNANRNDNCPCGSEKKYKKCCL